MGSQLKEKLNNKYHLVSLGSKDVDITSLAACNTLFVMHNADIVINLSGVNFDKIIHKITLNDVNYLDRMLQVNIKGTINIVGSCLPGMRAKGYGRIILISSTLATKNIFGTAVYSSCKAFIDKFVENISLENISKGITANSIQLGYFDGGLTHKMPQDIAKLIKDNIGLKRWGTIDELTSTIEYLINTEYVSGVNLRIDGG